jgi:hypothetical protein
MRPVGDGAKRPTTGVASVAPLSVIANETFPAQS